MAPPKRERRKDARPDEIIAAALYLYGTKGYSATSLGDIAAKARISRTTIYLYFPDKESIIRQAVQDRIGSELTAMRAHLTTLDAPFESVLRMLLKRMSDRLTDRSTLVILKVLVSEGQRMPDLIRFYHSQILEPGQAMIATLIQRGIDRQELRPQISAHDVRLLIAPVIMSAVWRLTFDDLDPLDLPALLQGHVDLMLNGMLRVP